MKTAFIVLYLLIGLLFCGATWRLSEEMESDEASDITMTLSLLYIVLWPPLLMLGFGRILMNRKLEDEKESNESIDEEMGVRN